MVQKAIEFAKINLKTYYCDHALLKIDIYKPETEGLFYAWLNKFEYVADMIEVPHDKMIEFFNKMIDPNVRTSVKQTFPFVNFSEHPYKDIINFYLRHFSPYEFDLHRARIWCREQYENETTEEYAESLQKIFYKCIPTNDLAERLFVQFVHGLRVNDEINN
ncbi:hypothetical protein M0804_014890 [Polistes exclamans]|nr:hypothetical protein M0804_014890 [Polistes exclamans]